MCFNKNWAIMMAKIPKRQPIQSLQDFYPIIDGLMGSMCVKCHDHTTEMVYGKYLDNLTDTVASPTR